MTRNSPGRPTILFLCLGNICRSPLAEGAARAAFAAAGIDATLDSAGTGDWHVGHPPDRRAQAEARRRGADISDLRARQLAPDDFYRFDLILAADTANLREARALAPSDATARIRLMLDLVPGRQGDSVTDPYYGDDGGFAATWDDVSAVAAALVAEASPETSPGTSSG
ncbi:MULTISPECIES: low molecular weight protein-tyrosine-phosphatase [unclassified Sphingopyxis]|jgi:protein-tyrosine phosphatase|uniref:low molecular weight protein-tyrosine-phosphatase n=1 Tax=unclassified Sphingopyxis TaxID=2614943 RepID=UPI00285B8BAB|nr:MULTISPECIES: low molecular weight protein-tyrosine-phosphatase [unclassified Sphingopyxis]MDR6833565.1 protein-tyrosine phosphatase [Sphingopyxis sp. BE122]MDR7225834.1 protein-tyrosine phosphatase [Sphingopyxis sp. BE259]